MDLVHLIYSSAATDKKLSPKDLSSILDQSRLNNSKNNITGMLLYESGAFFQVLEGDRTVVETVYERIVKDVRHEHATKLIEENISERSFSEWSMGYPKVTKKDLEQLEGLNDFFSRGNSFLQLESGRAKTLLNSFKKGKWRV